MTDASVEAGLGITLIDFILAVGASEARAAGTGVAIDFVCAYPSIEAGAFGAIRDVGFTVNASKTRLTGAGVRVNIVCTCPVILTGGTLTFIDL